MTFFAWYRQDGMGVLPKRADGPVDVIIKISGIWLVVSNMAGLWLPFLKKGMSSETQLTNSLTPSFFKMGTKRTTNQDSPGPFYRETRFLRIGLSVGKNYRTWPYLLANTSIPGLVNKQFANLKMAIERVDSGFNYPAINGGSFQRFLYVYQRVSLSNDLYTGHGCQNHIVDSWNRLFLMVNDEALLFVLCVTCRNQPNIGTMWD